MAAALHCLVTQATCTADAAEMTSALSAVLIAALPHPFVINKTDLRDIELRDCMHPAACIRHE